MQAKLQQIAAKYISLSIAGFPPPYFVIGATLAAAEIRHNQVLIVLCVMVATPNQNAVFAVPAPASVVFTHATCTSLSFMYSLSAGMVSATPW